ncbi:MAG: START domain-containing protein [Myxococcota bacterium]
MLAFLGFAVAQAALPGDNAGWETVRDDLVHVECAEVAGDFWCRADGVLDAPVDTVVDTLWNMPKHQDKFELVRSIVELGDNTLHITIDYPGMFSDRDYVAKYTRSTEGDAHRVSWVPVTHPKAPEAKGAVRLSKFEGEWRLTPKGTQTAVRYVWHADPGGSFPGWAKPLARKRAGHEALKDLAAAQGVKLVER